MIDNDSFCDDFTGHVALWCPAEIEDGDLARCAEYAMANGVSMVSVAPDDVGRMWVWLEHSRARVFARFYLPRTRDMASAAFDMAARINSAFKCGAAGAQVFLNASDLPAFAREMSTVSADLFFNRELEIGLDVSGINAMQWPTVFDAVRKLGASGVIFVLARDGGNRSDFVGRVHAALDAVGSDSRLALRFVVGNNFMRMEQALRLVAAMRPEMLGAVRVFFNMAQDLK